MRKNSQYLLKLISEIADVFEAKSDTGKMMISTSMKKRIPDLSNFFNLTTEDEAVILAYIINNSLLDQETSTEMIINNCFEKRISEWPKILKITSSLQERSLITEKIVGKGRGSISKKFYAESATLNAVIKGDNALLKRTTIEDFSDFVEELKGLLTKRRNQYVEFQDFVKQFQKLFSKYKNQFKELRWIDNQKLSTSDTILLFAFIIQHIEDESDYNYEKAVKQIYPSKERVSIKRCLSNSTNILVKKGILVKESDDMFEFIKLSEYALEKLFPENQELNTYKPKLGIIITYNQIKTEELFYNPAEKLQIDMLKNGLCNKNYYRIINKLKKHDVASQSFNALLYGSPGCGKTSSVFQIAKATSRNIYFVEIKSILSKYVGETEKRITQLFRDYKQWNKSQENKGILLINELDTIFSKRVQVIGSNDQFSNQVVSTFLQEIELCTDGIVMATTNCIDLDPALDRRFLFKIHFELPIEEISSQIIENKLNIKGVKIETEFLKGRHLTGAQIMNLKQKIIIKNITEGTTVFSEDLKELVQEELALSKHQIRTVIGFK